jgi:cutinase
MTRNLALIFAFAAVAPVVSAIAPVATAAPCPDVQVVFARGTTEPPGLGSVGRPFVEDLRARVAPRTVEATPVDYPASNDFAVSTPAGIDAARSVIESTAASCPKTKMVLGGYSQGAAVIEGATNAAPQLASRVAATALFGAPRTGFSAMLAGGPLPELAPQYVANSIDQCAEGDPICWVGGGFDVGAHGSYVQSGKVTQAADFAAGRL